MHIRLLMRKRIIKKNEPIFRIHIEKCAYLVVNTDNVLCAVCDSIDDLGNTCALFSNMPWQIDAGDLAFFDKKVERDFWNAYDNACQREKEHYIKLYHTNFI